MSERGRALGRRSFITGVISLGAAGMFALAEGCEANGGSQSSTQSSSPRGQNTTSSSPRLVEPKNTRGFAISVDTLLGLNQQQTTQHFALAKRLGANEVRVDFDGSIAGDQRRGKYNWDVTDRIMTAAVKNKLAVTALLSYTAEQDRQSPQTNYTARPLPADAGLFIDWGVAVADKYKVITDFEGWNEANISPNGADPVSYTQELYLPLRKRLVAANHSARLAIGGLAPSATAQGAMSPSDFLVAAYDAGLTKPDAIAVHPYSFPVLPDQVEPWSAFSLIEDDPDSIYSVLVAGDKDTPIWITEFGAPTQGAGVAVTSNNEQLSDFNADTGYVSFDFQATSIAQMLLHHFREANVGKRLVYTVADTQNGGQPNPQDGYGVYTAGVIGQPLNQAYLYEKAAAQAFENPARYLAVHTT